MKKHSVVGSEGAGMEKELLRGDALEQSKAEQRCRCRSRCEQLVVEFLGTRWRPTLSRPLRRRANSVERLIARSWQSCLVVCQGRM